MVYPLPFSSVGRLVAREKGREGGDRGREGGKEGGREGGREGGDFNSQPGKPVRCCLNSLLERTV